LSLFGETDDSASDLADQASLLALAHVEAADLADRLPANVRFGTSSWSFPGWRGIVYRRGLPQSALAREGLREYARHPLLRTVGVDRSFYAPVPVEDLTRYAEQLPAAFPCCFKAPASIASPTVPFERAGQPNRNPHFLSAERFAAELLEPVAKVFREHAGPFVVEISPAVREFRLEPHAFCDGLDRMLSALPREFQYAVELREPTLITDEYARVLRIHGAAHVYNYWSAMPMPARQAAQVPVAEMPFLVVRLLLRPGTRYEGQREAFRPFDRIVQPDEGMRDQVADLVAEAVGRAIPAYVLVNNKAEGSAPLTIRELARRVVERLS
jgi:uncharacterized protein YecE (DUF72 family)